MRIKYFATRAEVEEAAKRCMAIIKTRRPWTSEWTHTSYEWFANDGLVYWELCIGRSFEGYYLVVTIWGEDQMYYNWCVPCDGTPEEVIENCLVARQVDVDGGEIWSCL